MLKITFSFQLNPPKGVEFTVVGERVNQPHIRKAAIYVHFYILNYFLRKSATEKTEAITILNSFLLC